MKNRVNQLTPNEKAKAEKAAYEAWLKTQEIYSPPPEASKTDLIHENKRVMTVLTNVVSWLPGLLGIVMIASILVSLDKTAAAFHAAVANKIWGWEFIVAMSGVVMADAALVIAEFALVRDMLKKGLRRQVWTVSSLWRSVLVRLGKVPPLDYSDMPDPSLRFYSRFVFWLVLSANVYAVTHTSHITQLSDITFDTGLFLFVGIAGALSLRFIGQQMAHIVYELMDERRRLETVDLRETWRQDMMALWDTEARRVISTAWHEAFLKKNHLPLDAGSPYLLVAGPEGNSFEIAPLAVSQDHLLTPYIGSNGNGTHQP